MPVLTTHTAGAQHPGRWTSSAESGSGAPMAGLAEGTQIVLTFFGWEAGRWEGVNFEVWLGSP